DFPSTSGFLRILLDLDDQASDELVARDQHLMGQAGWHMGQIACAQFLLHSTLNVCAANLAGSNRLRARDGAASEQSGAAIDHDEQIGEACMLLGASVSAA